jgi:hypothetical protein
LTIGAAIRPNNEESTVDKGSHPNNDYRQRKSLPRIWFSKGFFLYCREKLQKITPIDPKPMILTKVKERGAKTIERCMMKTMAMKDKT